jgi:hypothetical protein
VKKGLSDKNTAQVVEKRTLNRNNRQCPEEAQMNGISSRKRATATPRQPPHFVEAGQATRKQGDWTKKWMVASENNLAINLTVSNQSMSRPKRPFITGSLSFMISRTMLSC